VTGGLARRYARALLELAREAGSLTDSGEELAAVAAAFEEPRLRAVVLNPAVDAGARRKIVAGVVDAMGLAAHVGNLVRLLADRDRLTQLSQVSQAYDDLVDAEVGRSRVRIRSAAPLGPAEKAEVTELAKRLVGAKEIVVTTDVDAELLGGVILDAGGTVWDGSVRTQLARIAKEMAGSGA
jgi:F-type H+-transporting ATPase subunit delta